MEHIGVYRLYEIAANIESLDDNDFRHLELCPECLEVFKALTDCNRTSTELGQQIHYTTPEQVS